MEQAFPKWATPERRMWLALQLAKRLDVRLWEVDLFSGETHCPEYKKLLDTLKYCWQQDDREHRAALHRREQEYLHPVERIRQGRFDSIARDIFMASQPSHYVEATGIDALRRQAVVKVRLASSPVRLLVNVPQAPQAEEPAPQRASAHAWRKFKRYGKGRLAQAIEQAVSDYRNSPA